jgi:general secretion pathway protein G
MIQRSHRAEMRGGFTLMEMLVVVAIIVLLAAMAAPLVMGYLDKAKADRAKADVQTWTSAVTAYKLAYGDWPPSLAALTQVQADGRTPFMEPKHLYDPWQHEYQYQAIGQHMSVYGKPDIWSLGPPNTNIPIGNWQ